MKLSHEVKKLHFIKEALGIFTIAVLCHSSCFFDQQRFQLTSPLYLFQVTKHDNSAKPKISGKLRKSLSELKDEEVVKAVGRYNSFPVNLIKKNLFS